MSQNLRSPKWSKTTKIFVASIMLLLFVFTVWRFSALIGPLVIAGMIAYLLNPIIFWLDEHTPLSRGVAIGLVYPILALIVLALLVAAGVTIYQQAIGLIGVVQGIIWKAPETIEALAQRPPVEMGPWVLDVNSLNFDIQEISQQLLSTIQPVMSQSAQFVGMAASATATWIGWTIIIFVISIYFAIDLPHFSDSIIQAIYQPGYRQDVERLMEESGRIWNGYLRGQTTLAVLMAMIFTVVLQLLGVRFALVLGLLAGILDFFPYVGPTIVVTLSALVAVFQGANWLGLNPLWFGILVLVVGLTIQQIEGNWLNPRIVGGALGLHPLMVMVGAIMGSILAGILGVMLAAPVLATIKLLSIYAWRKMFDLDPFPDIELPKQKEESYPPQLESLSQEKPRPHRVSPSQ